ncbi:MAG: ThiF family adenylyltransferase, partial [Spirochaetaceae bacterium]|nr:ThiF family adenylyltransferase [Spirochaetaceae bacterium]
VFGIGGVGGHVVEALVRAGVGALDLIDADTVSESNITHRLRSGEEGVPGPVLRTGAGAEG